MKKTKIGTFIILLISVLTIGYKSLYATFPTKADVVMEIVYADQEGVNPLMSQSNRNVGSVYTVNPNYFLIEDNYEFVYWIINGSIRPNLPSKASFFVQSGETHALAIYKPEGTNAVIYVDSNGKLIDYETVISGNKPTKVIDIGEFSKPGSLPIGFFSEDNLTPNDKIYSDIIFFMLYETYEAGGSLTVNGTNISEMFLLNEVVAVGSHAPNNFSYWQDENGQILSSKANYKFTMLGFNRTIFSTTNIGAPENIINMTGDLELREDYITVVGQFEGNPSEVGFLISEEDDLIETSSQQGVEIVVSNVHNSETGEFVMSFPYNIKSIRAYGLFNGVVILSGYNHISDKKLINLENIDITEFNFSGDDTFTFITNDFYLPTSFEEGAVTALWESSDNAVIEIIGNKAKVTRTIKEDVVVDLVATLYYQGEDGNLEILEREPVQVTVKRDDDTYVVYINIDGFAQYYYDEAISRNKVPKIEALRNDGVYFTNLRTEFPSTTNPLQFMIISGATSNQAQNAYRYYDKENNIVVSQARPTHLDTIYTAAARKNLTMASVRHFPAEGVMSTSNLNRLYVNTDSAAEYPNQEARFSQAIKLVRGEPFRNGDIIQTVSEVPRLLTVYTDEIDALGHNYDSAYGISKASNETGRINNVIGRIDELDNLINDLVNAYKYRGIYDKTAFFITTDHGMTPLGNDAWRLFGDGEYGKGRQNELKTKLKQINSAYEFEYLGPGESPKSSTTVVGVSGALQMALTFKNTYLVESELQTIKTALETEYYIDQVLTRREVWNIGGWTGANIDLLVIPKGKYHFHGRDNPNHVYYANGQHDTLLLSSNNIFGMIFGGLVQNNITITNKTSVLTFGPSMAYVLGLDLYDATADVLDVFQ